VPGQLVIASSGGSRLGCEPGGCTWADGLAVLPAGPPEAVRRMGQIVVVAVGQVLAEQRAAWVLVGGYEPAVKSAFADRVPGSSGLHEGGVSAGPGRFALASAGSTAAAAQRWLPA
jgi:hypothetical protein